MKNGNKVKIANRAKGESNYIQGYTGMATIINETPNSYGLLKVILFVEAGFPAQHNPAYYSPSQLTVIK